MKVTKRHRPKPERVPDTPNRAMDFLAQAAAHIKKGPSFLGQPEARQILLTAIGDIEIEKFRSEAANTAPTDCPTPQGEGNLPHPPQEVGSETSTI